MDTKTITKKSVKCNEMLLLINGNVAGIVNEVTFSDDEYKYNLKKVG
jgi:hypothetical protein